MYFGMTTEYEQEYFEAYTRDMYRGLGEIVDLGCWLGATTIPLAKGLSQRSEIEGRKVHALDLFHWKSWMDPYLSGCHYSYSEGDTFLPEFISRTQEWSDWIAVKQTDLQTYRWSGKPIEFCLSTQ